MLSKLSILNTETNKLLILNTTHISNKLFSTVSSQGKPTWRITYNDVDEEDSEFIDNNYKGFGKINTNEIKPKKKKIASASNSLDNKINENEALNSNFKISASRKIKEKSIKNNKNEKSIVTFNNPDFEIIKSTNSESVLFAKLNPNSLFYAKYGTVVGLSSKVKIELSYEDNTDEVLKGGNGSGIFAFEKVWTEDKSGQVLLVPVNGDLMLINVKKNKEYIVKGKALFGAVSTINVKDYFHNNHKFEGVKYFIVKGKGTIAIEGEGGVLEVTLNEDEHFLVKPSTLLAFESQMSVKPVLSSACTDEVDENILEKQVNGDKSFWKKAKGMIDRAKIYISGDQLFYKLKGPGKFYISTRIPTLSGLQSFKLNNKDKKANSKIIQKRNYSTNARPKALDEYEPELENEISTLQKKLMEKTLNKQVSKKNINKKKNKSKAASSKKNSKNSRYPNSINEKSDDEITSNEYTSSPYQAIIDEKAVLYKKSDKVKSPKSSMFFNSRESKEEVNIEKPLIKTPKKNSIDVYLDEDVGESIIKENNKYKMNKFSLSSHQNRNLKYIINSEQKENKDRSINSMFEKRTAEIKAEQKRKRQQELNPRKYADIEETYDDDNDEDDTENIDENEINENEYVDEDIGKENEDIEEQEQMNENEEEEYDDVEEEEEEEYDDDIDKEEKEKVKPSKLTNNNKVQKRQSKVVKIESEPEQEKTEQKTWTMKENIKDNKFFTFGDKNAIALSSAAINSKKSKDDSESSLKSSLKKKSSTKKIKKSSNLSMQSNVKSSSKNSMNKIENKNRKLNKRQNKNNISNRSISSSSKTRNLTSKKQVKSYLNRESNYKNNKTIHDDNKRMIKNEQIYDEEDSDIVDDDDLENNETFEEDEFIDEHGDIDEEEIEDDNEEEYIENDNENDEYIDDENEDYYEGDDDVENEVIIDEDEEEIVEEENDDE